MTTTPARVLLEDALRPDHEETELYPLFESAPGDVKLKLDIDLLAMHLSDDDEEVRVLTHDLNVEFVTAKERVDREACNLSSLAARHTQEGERVAVERIEQHPVLRSSKVPINSPTCWDAITPG